MVNLNFYSSQRTSSPIIQFERTLTVEQEVGGSSPPNCTSGFRFANVRAFSSEVETGSRQENASNEESGASLRFHRSGNGSSTTESEGRRSLDLRIKYEEHSHRETGDWDGFPWSEGGPSAFYAVRRKSCQRDRARGSGGAVAGLLHGPNCFGSPQER